MVNVQGKAQHREIGMNDEIYAEKKSTPYRDVNCQYYPYLPYISHFTNLQISSKVKTAKVLTFNNSYVGFLCPLGTSEAKNVGRIMMLTRNTFVSTQDDTNYVYSMLNIVVGHENVYIVVNSACIPVTQNCFDAVDLNRLKRQLTFIECFQDKNFIIINYKVGLMFKQLTDTIWVTARDISFWIKKIYGFDEMTQLLDLKEPSFITSYSTDIIKYYQHNAIPKNLLALNALKNSVLATTPVYSLYFCEAVSAYAIKNSLYHPILEPLNEFSKPFTIYLPKLNVMYASFKGCTQEDCIVLREDLDVFDSYRLYTVKIKFGNEAQKYFHPVIGPTNRPNSFLGTISCETEKIEIVSNTMHLFLEKRGDRAIHVTFTKPNFEIVKFKISPSFLFINIQSFHKCSAGDKLCTLHGQKGVLQKHLKLPYAEGMVPDILVNPYCLISRQTMGQIIESIHNGGKDYDILYNSDGKRMPGKSFIGPVSYMLMLYFSSEHIYFANKCIKDKGTGQPVRGRSRQGGMKIGNMELFNGMIGNGIASSNTEVWEHSDLIMVDDVPIPQSVVVCHQDANCFKCNIEYTIEPPVLDK